MTMADILLTAKDTDGEDIDAIYSVLVVVPVKGTVTAQENPSFTAWKLKCRRAVTLDYWAKHTDTYFFTQ